MKADTRAMRIKVGAFLALGFLAAGLAIFAIGEERGLFRMKAALHAEFDNVNGLVVGAPVRLAGLNVGTVQAIEFPDDIHRRSARVTLHVESRYLPRVRADSLAFIDSKGLLGDKLVNLTLGSPEADPVKDGDTLRTRTALTVEDLAGTLDQAAASFAGLSRKGEQVLAEFATDEVQRNVARAVASTAAILEAVERGDGLAGRLLNDPRYADGLFSVIEETREALATSHNILSRVDRLLARAEQGDDALSRLLLGKEGREALVSLRDASGNLAAVLAEVREGAGLAHAVIYDPDQVRMLEELTQFASRLNRLAADVEKGRGTVGGLMVDPSVYEDMKTILGNVERNVLLKALMRYTIKEGDIERPALMPEAAGPP